MTKNKKLPDNQITVYQTPDGKINIEVLYANENIWMPQKRMAELFGCTADNISLHLKNIYQEKELYESATTEEFSVVQIEGSRTVSRKITCYSLEAIIAVGYRVNSELGTLFRQWAIAILQQYIHKGFAIDSDRFKYGSRFSMRYFDDLLEEIRDIRSSERMAYQKITDIYATSIDYSQKAEDTKQFFATVQNKLHFAITGQTAAEIIAHFGQRQEVFEGKGMIVAMSRRIAADLYDEIIKIKPGWHNDDLNKGVIKVVMTSASSDGPKISKHHTTKEQRRALAERMKDTEDELKLVIVRDMWLTGFDVPSLHTMYIDKPMKGHTLMQAIARVNRVYKDKPGGLVVDYLGIASDLKEALSFYSDSGGKGDPAVLQEQAVQLMLEKLEIVSQMFHGFPYEHYFTADTSTKLSIILAAEEHILGIENGKKRYIDEVTALSRAFSIAIPHEQAMDVKDEVSFYQAIKARLVKFDSTGTGKTDEEIETAIRQVIDQALITEQVIDVFDAAGIKKPDISILSEEFLLEVQNMEHKNIALEVLKKLFNDEIKARLKKNMVQSRSLMEMLEDSIKKYHNKVITAAEVIEELIELSKEIKRMDKEPQEMGLSEFEYAFYTAIADNDSARELMQKEKLRELAVVLFEKVKQNASIDWTIKESVRAKLKVIVKRTLRQYDYPPNMQALATETVLKQAELIADELTKRR